MLINCLLDSLHEASSRIASVDDLIKVRREYIFEGYFYSRIFHIFGSSKSRVVTKSQCSTRKGTPTS